MMPLLISYFTADWKYPQHAYELRQQCDALGLEHHIEERPSVYSYKVHCRQRVPQDAEVVCFHGKPRPWEVSLRF